MRSLAAILTFLLVWGAFVPAQAADKEKESSYDRIMRTGTIRCGYLPYEPYISKDVVSGALSGVTVDYINAVAKRLGLSVDWSEEVNVDQIAPALNYGRIDMVCIPCTPDHNWANVIAFEGEWNATPYYTYVREDSELTEEQLETGKFVTVDGYALTEITHDAYPDAAYLSLPQMTSMAEMYDQLRYNKADALVNDALSAALYSKNNPGIIRRFSDTPVISMRMFLPTRHGDDKMNAFMHEKFAADLPENLALMKELVVKYEVPEGGILLGDHCKPAETAKGEKICAPESPEKETP